MYRRLFFLMILSAFLAPSLFANTIHSCRTQKNVKSNKKQRICYVKVTDGEVRVGSTVEVKNQYNYIVATGKVVKTKRRKHSGSYALIVLTKIYKVVKSGYPVFVRNNDSIDYWTATKAPY